MFHRLQKELDMVKLLLFQQFSVNFFINMPYTQAKQHPVFHVKTEIINWILKMPQMRSDYLLKHKILVVSPQEKLGDESHEANNAYPKKLKEYLNYIELCTASLNYQINLQDIKNIWQKLDHINFRMCVNSLWIVFQKEKALEETTELNKIKGLQALIDNIHLSTLLHLKPVGLIDSAKHDELPEN